MQRLINEVHLNNTYYLIGPYPKNVMQQMTHGYYQEMYGIEDMTTIDGSWAQAGGAIVSSTNNLLSWEYLFYHSGVLFKLKNTKTGKATTSFDDIGYSFGAFRMNTAEGIIWFTPGLTPGYISMIAYSPCLQAYFAYSASVAPLKGLHRDMISGVLHILNQNKQYRSFRQKKITLPEYCERVKPASQFRFPKI